MHRRSMIVDIGAFSSARPLISINITKITFTTKLHRTYLFYTCFFMRSAPLSILWVRIDNISSHKRNRALESNSRTYNIVFA